MSTVDRVQQAVMAELIGGTVRPGTWLRQDLLAVDLGVSKIPVREALQRLVASGLLRMEANRGVVVPTLTAADAEENYTLRRAIEPQLLRQAIPRMDAADLDEAEALLSTSTRSVTAANWSFHRALYQPSGWDRGVVMTEILHASVAPYVLLYLESLGGRGASDSEHTDLLAACRDGDVESAATVLDRHLSQAADALMSFLREAAGDE